MRRSDREMDAKFALTIIDKSTHGVLSMVDLNGVPYGVPLSIVRKGDFLYFHSAKAGKKVNILAQNNQVSVSFVGDVIVPELYSEDELVTIKNDPSALAQLSSRMFTTQYESAIVFGEITLVESDGEKMEALRIICEKYTATKMEFFELAARPALSKTAIYKVLIKEITGKRKKFDDAGEEMKWGRMK